MISLYINGTSQAFDQVGTVADLVAALNLGGKRIAIECNGEIVPRSTFAQHPLHEGDRIEIVVAVGGG